MMLSQSLFALTLLPFASHAAETILGVYIFSRHGDRNSKSTPPTLLTNLGYSEVFSSGSWFRNHYIANGSTSQIYNISSDVVKQSQIAASAPLDTVLMPSCLGFLQGLYPPVGDELGAQTLSNGTTVQTPLNGYQIIPVATVQSGTGSENDAWLQGSSNCANAIVSSNNYYTSPEYKDLANRTMSFYQSFIPLVNSTFPPDQVSFKNAYTIFDYVNVATIHNRTSTIPSSNLLNSSTFAQLQTLADTHEFNLAYNASDSIRAITGSTLAAQILSALNATVTSASSTKKPPSLNIQFGAYGGFQSFFGLANLTQQDADFFGIPDYASTMTFELFTNAPPEPFPAPEQLGVRFLFHNGTTGNDSTPKAYPLFGSTNETMAWNDFVTGINKFAVGDQASWCKACGNTTGVCAVAASGGPPAPAKSSSGGGGGNGLSPAVNGVIGAMVTLAVILGVEALVLLLAGLRVVKKRGMGPSNNATGDGPVFGPKETRNGS